MKKWIMRILLLAYVFSLPGCKNAQEQISAGDWQEQYELGVRYLSEGNYQEAIIAFTAAIEIDPKQAEAYIGRGDAYILSGGTEENLIAARQDYELAFDIDAEGSVSKLVDAYIALSGIYIRETRYEEAIDILSKAISRDTGCVDAYRGLADAYMQMGDRASAETILQQGYDATGDETLLQAYYSVLRTDDELYARLSDTYLDFLDRLAAAVTAQDWQTALSLQTSQTCGELLAILPFNEDESRYTLTYYPSDSMQVNFFRDAGEGPSENHVDIYTGSGGNGEVVVSVYNGSFYYMRKELFSGGAVNGEAIEYSFLFRDDGQPAQLFTKTGTIQNNETVGQVLYTSDDGTSAYADDAFYIQTWPAALN